MKFNKAIFAVCVLVLLGCSGCSTITFGYNHADWLLRYWINDYTSFDAQQKKEIRRDVADYVSWHRQHALPEYVAFLQNLNTTVHQQSLSTEDVERAKDGISRLYKLTMAPSILPAAHLLSTLDAQQIAELRDNLASGDRKLRKDALSGSEDENLTRRANDQLRSVKMLVGRLSKRQQDRIMEMSRHLPFVTRYYIDQREAQQAILISMLKSHAGEDKIAAMFRQWLNEPDAQASPQEQRMLHDYDKAMNEMIVQIFGLLTPDQKEHLRNKISDYISVFQKLHAATQVGATPTP